MLSLMQSLHLQVTIFQLTLISLLHMDILADLSSPQAQKTGVVSATPVSPMSLRLPVVGAGRNRVLFSLTSSVYFEVTIV